MDDVGGFAFWDTETTGLDKHFHVPVEIGGLVTDGDLRPIRSFELEAGRRDCAARSRRASRNRPLDHRAKWQTTILLRGHEGVRCRSASGHADLLRYLQWRELRRSFYPARILQEPAPSVSYAEKAAIGGSIF